MNIHSITIEAGADAVRAAESFYRTTLGLAHLVSVRATAQPSTGFRGFAPSLIFEQPGDVDAAVERALGDGAQPLKPVEKSLWGYGGSLQAPDGTAWQLASANKTATGPATGKIDRFVLLLGVDSIKTSKRFYQHQGLTTTKNFPAYVEFGSGSITLALYRRAALAKQVGVAPEGTGAHRLGINADGAFTDPDGYAWFAAETVITA